MSWFLELFTNTESPIKLVENEDELSTLIGEVNELKIRENNLLKEVAKAVTETKQLETQNKILNDMLSAEIMKNNRVFLPQ